MDLHVGAVSQRVVEVAARMQVPAIVASQRQVNIDGGYIGMTPEVLVEKVFEWSKGKTRVIRDHGGPVSKHDVTFVMRLEADRAAGFDALHLDVSKVDRAEQRGLLSHLLTRFPLTDVEVGGERDEYRWMLYLAQFAHARHPHVTSAIVPLGGHIWNDKQIGRTASWVEAVEICDVFRLHAPTKAHNMDWVDTTRYEGALDAYNIAPEIAKIETEAWLQRLSPTDAGVLLEAGLRSNQWKYWYREGEGSQYERALTGVRYVMETDEVKRILARYDVEGYVRGRIHEHLQSR